MSNPNFVSDLVAMAKAYEELPQVKAELEAAKHDVQVGLERIQSLELRLIDRANELDAAHAATRKAEVERDHAETMFLETDDKLQKSLDVLKVVIGDANDFLRAVEPPKPERVAEPQAEAKVGASEGERAVDPTPVSSEGTSQSVPSTSEHIVAPSTSTSTEEAPHSVDPISAPSREVSASTPSTAPDASAVSGESVASSTTGESAADPTLTTTSEPASTAQDDTHSSTLNEGISVPSDPTLATGSSSENASSALASQPEPELRYSPEWYQWADAVGYWDRPHHANVS